MRRYLLLCMCWVCALLATAQTGWKTYLSYYGTTQVAETRHQVFAVANGSLYRYDKADQQVKFYSTEDGLGDTNIGHIGYNETTESLLITYAGGNSEGNMDLLSADGIYHLPYLKNSTNYQDKTIHGLYFQDRYAYVATAFGIVVVDMQAQEVKDTYRFETVYGVCCLNNQLYAATPQGLMAGALSDNLLDPQNWHVVDANPVDQVVNFGGQLYLLQQGVGIFRYTSAGRQSFLADKNLTDLTVTGTKMVALKSGSAVVWKSASQKETLSIQSTAIQGVASLEDTYWLAAAEKGLLGMQNNQLIVSDLVLVDQSPKRNLAYSMTFAQGRLYVVGGGRWTDRYRNPGTLMIYDGSSWLNFDESKVSARDYMQVAVDPTDPTHYFVSTYGEGVLEFQEDQFVKQYLTTGTTLQSAIPTSNNYIRVTGLVFDKEGNLWMNNSSVSQPIHCLQADGTWKAYDSSLGPTEMPDQMICTANGNIWMNIPYNTHTGLYVFNQESDTFLGSVASANGATINVNAYYCLAEDRNGDIWVGTNRGVIISPAGSARNVLTQPIYFRRPTRDDNTAYFLDGERVNAIAVDGGNQKWIATETSGVYLVNEDGSETLEHFSTDNSPLLSDKVNSIAIHSETGEVFFGTDKGICSYQGTATAGSADYNNVYAYPNPVRPTDPRRVTITGLMNDSNVKITDLAGNLLYQAKSLGGQLSWNCSGVKSGIYLVLAATEDGGEGVVTKIMIVN